MRIVLLAAAAAAPHAGCERFRPDTNEIADEGLFMKFVDGEVWRRTTAGERLAAQVEGRRPAISSRFDVHLVDDTLIYVREACGPADVAAPFFLHLEPVDPDDLPGPRRPHGFDNLDFRFDAQGTTFGGACLAVARLPAYDVAAIRTGQHEEAEGGSHRSWEGEIRPGADGTGRVGIARSTDPLPGNAAARRIELLDGGPLREPVLWYGGRFQFMDVCPEWGCLAVQFGTDGEVAHAWPLRPGALERAAHDAGDPRLLPDVRDAAPVGISQYPNGDLLVVFFSYGASVARIDPQGYPVWFRRGYGHHWPHLDDDGAVLVPRASFGPISVPLAGGDGTVTLECGHPRGSNREWVNVIGGDGRLLDSIDLTGALLESPFAHLLADADGCNPVWLNFIHRVAGDVGRNAWGLSSGDLVVSMRELSAFAILDAASGRVKRLVTGAFRFQHAVHHFEGSRFLLFDNLGAGEDGPSRLLMVDLADGRETTIFPNHATPEALRGLFSRYAGKISISPDRGRAIVVFSREGVAVEVRLPDGAALKVFRSLHDVSGLEQFSEKRAVQPAMFRTMGLDYVDAGDSPW